MYFAGLNLIARAASAADGSQIQLLLFPICKRQLLVQLEPHPECAQTILLCIVMIGLEFDIVKLCYHSKLISSRRFLYKDCRHITSLSHLDRKLQTLSS